MRGPCAVTMARGRIVDVAAGNAAPPGAKAVALPAGSMLAPGFIDVQVNGGGGVLLNDEPTLEGIRKIAAAHRAFGTTGLLPTLITDDRATLKRLAAVAQEAMTIPGVLGFHLEGPALNPARKGIHPPQHIRRLGEEDITLILSFAACGRSQVTLAPEMVDAGVIKRFVDAGLRVSIGHSEATAAQVSAAVENGVTGVTHLFNAMSQMQAREPGVVGAALHDDRLFAGIICDGAHVHPVNLSVAYRAKGRARLMLVTDAMSSIGSRNTHFQLLGREITLKDGRLTGPDGTLAGAHLDMMSAVGHAIKMMSVSLEDALIMASYTPAMFLGLEKERGLIEKGYHADLVAFDGNHRVIATWIGGVDDS